MVIKPGLHEAGCAFAVIIKPGNGFMRGKKFIVNSSCEELLENNPAFRCIQPVVEPVKLSNACRDDVPWGH